MTPQEIQIVHKAHHNLAKLNASEIGFVRGLYDNLPQKRTYSLSHKQSSWLHSIDEKLFKLGITSCTAGTVMTTDSGLPLDFADPRPEQISILDIARGLANACRFAGQCVRFYSVAAHSMRVAELVPPGQRLAALLHDAPEAYLGDKITPAKALLPDLRRLESSIWKAVSRRFVISEDLSQEIKEADRIAFEEEANVVHRHLKFPDRPAVPLNYATGEDLVTQFLDAFHRYGGREAGSAQ